MSWELILKEIPFKIRDFRAIEKRAKKIWNDGGRKERLSNILVREVKKKYEKYVSLENLLEDFAKFNNLEMEEMMDVYPLMESLLQTERGAGKFAGFDKFTDSEILRQLEAFKDNLEREQSKRELEDEPETQTLTSPKSGKKAKTSRLDSFEDSFPKSAQLFREWVKSTSFKNLNELLSLVGSPTIGDEKTMLRLTKFIEEEDLTEQDKKALKAVLTEMKKELNKKPKTIAALTPNAVEVKGIGIKVGQNSRISKTSLNIRYGDGRSEQFRGRRKDFINKFQRLDLTSENYYNNTRLREIFEYWVDQMEDFNGSAAKFMQLSEKEKLSHINKIRQRIPEYPIETAPTAILYATVFKNRDSPYYVDEARKEEEFAYFAQGLRDGLSGGESSRKAFDFNTLKRFNDVTLPSMVNAIKKGIFITTDSEGRQQIQTRLGPVITKEMNKIAKSDDEKREIISALFDIVKGRSLSTKYTGSDKEVLASVERSINEKLRERVPDTPNGKSVMFHLTKTFLEIYKKEGILSGLLDSKKLKDVEYLTPQEVTPPERKKSGRELREVKKSLDNLLVVLGEEDEIIIKEDVGLILESLDKKQKKKVKAILNIADPTEYFGHDFLKLSELIRLLKTLGVVKGDKKLNKKIIRYDEENVKVVKLAARLRKDYERLYNDLREMVYPKSGE